MSSIPLWPSLQPRSTDPLWFNADKPCDDEDVVDKLESSHQAWVSYFNTSCYFNIMNKQ